MKVWKREKQARKGRKRWGVCTFITLFWIFTPYLFRL